MSNFEMEKDIKDSDLLSEQDDSNDEKYTNNNRASVVSDESDQPTAQDTQQHLSINPQHLPSLADYERSGTWNNPAPPVQMPASVNVKAEPVTPAKSPSTQGDLNTSGVTTARVLASNSRLGIVRPPRNRAPVPASDPHPRLPTNWVFPQTPEQIGEGLGSGRNWLVVIESQIEPVLRAPLIVVRCKREPAGQSPSNYPDETNVIPAGLPLSHVCRVFPRHVWGEMLRIFISERWHARRIWELLPPDVRNNANHRPWNYLQAAMGREVDTMALEETGIRRIPVKREKSEDANDANVHPLQQDQQSAEEDRGSRMTIDELIEYTRQTRMVGINDEREILWLRYGQGTEEEAERAWRLRHERWGRSIFEAMEAVDINPEGIKEPIEMMRIVWMWMNERRDTESEEDYIARSRWHAWRNYAGVIQTLAANVDEELAALQGEEDTEVIVKVEEYEGRAASDTGS